MRRILLASLIALAPGLALAQSAPASPPPAAGDDTATGMGPDMMGPGMGPDMMGPRQGGPGRKGPWAGPEESLIDFYAANTTHDGHLTLAQAKAADFKPVVEHFSAIDVANHGYVTFYDIEAWRLDWMAKSLEARAAALRAKD